MKLMVTGSKGQLGTELLRQPGRHEVVAADCQALDITNADAVSGFISKFNPGAVINAAAYTAVDKAESDREAAFAVNRDGPKNLARVCADMDIPLVHVSTDYVFDGSKQGAYVETDPVVPLGVYGKSKLAGEQAVQELCPNHLIVRTSWVFSAQGNNFVTTMLRLGAEREELGVVADQIGKPTSAGELAQVILSILPDINGRWGTYHLAQPGVTSWYGFAEAIFDETRQQGMDMKIRKINAVTTSDYPTPAKRPANSELDCSKLESTFRISIKPWKESLAKVIMELAHG